MKNIRKEENSLGALREDNRKVWIQIGQGLKWGARRQESDG